MEINRPSFPQMVSDLFKKMPGHGAAMLHAAIGIAGESAEINCADTRKNLFEECGDMEFYIEAAWQSMGLVLNQHLRNVTVYRASEDIRVANITVSNVLDHIHTLSGDFLDQAKKVWVYEDGNRDATLAKLLIGLEFNLSKLYEFYGTTREEIQAFNQDKLLGNEKIRGRYATGKYSNDQALARADKETHLGEQRAQTMGVLMKEEEDKALAETRKFMSETNGSK